jgi:AbiV family abortive infection protein
MKFDKIKILSNSELIKGIDYCYSNSNELLESALILKKEGKFGTSISCVILSIEELIKAYTLFMIMILEDGEKEACRDIFESNDLHKSRNKLALFYNEIFKLINREEIENLEITSNRNDNFLADYIQKEQILEKSLLNTEKENQTSKNWFSHAHQKKNEGLYVDYNKKWLFPKRLTIKDSEKAFEEIVFIKKFISETLEFMISNQDNIDNLIMELKEFKKKVC